MMKFEIEYWPEQSGDPAFWVGFSKIIETDTLEEAEQTMWTEYGDDNPILVPLNTEAKTAYDKAHPLASDVRLQEFLDEIFQ